MLPVLGLVGIQVLLLSNIGRLVLPHAIYSYFSAIGVVARLVVLGLVGIQVLLLSNIGRLVLPHAIYSYRSAIGVVARLVVLGHLMPGITAGSMLGDALIVRGPLLTLPRCLALPDAFFIRPAR